MAGCVALQTERTSDGSLLTIPNIQLTDTGRYTCVMKSGTIVLSADTYLTQPKSSKLNKLLFRRSEHAAASAELPSSDQAHTSLPAPASSGVAEEERRQEQLLAPSGLTYEHARGYGAMNELVLDTTVAERMVAQRQHNPSPFGDYIDTEGDLSQLHAAQSRRAKRV